MSEYLEVKLVDGHLIDIDLSNIAGYLKVEDTGQAWYSILVDRFATIDIDDECLDEFMTSYYDIYTEMKSRNISKLCVYVSVIVDALGPRKEFSKDNVKFSRFHVSGQVKRILLKYCINDIWHESVDNTVFIHYVNRALANAHEDRETLSKLNINIESITLKER